MDKPVSEMNKQELRDHAKQVFGVDLDMRKSVENLQEEVGKLKPKQATVKVESVPKPKATHLKNPTTGLFWPWHPLLAEKGGLVPCDKDGHVIE